VKDTERFPTMKELIILSQPIRARRLEELRLLRKVLGSNVRVEDSVVDIPVYDPEQNCLMGQLRERWRNDVR